MGDSCTAAAAGAEIATAATATPSVSAAAASSATPRVCAGVGTKGVPGRCRPSTSVWSESAAGAGEAVARGGVGIAFSAASAGPAGSSSPAVLGAWPFHQPCFRSAFLDETCQVNALPFAGHGRVQRGLLQALLDAVDTLDGGIADVCFAFAIPFFSYASPAMLPNLVFRVNKNMQGNEGWKNLSLGLCFSRIQEKAMAKPFEVCQLRCQRRCKSALK